VSDESNEPRESLKESVVDVAGLTAYLKLFRMLPRPVRLLGYFSIVLALPFYLGLTPKLAQDLFNEPIEDWEIRLEWREPRTWTGRYSSGAVKEFVSSRWYGSSKANLAGGNALLVKPNEPVFYKLKSDVFGLYDFYVKFDVEILKGQKELYWLVRANRSHDTYYKFRLQWEKDTKYWRFDGFSTDGGEDDEEPLFINEHLLEVSPLVTGDKLSILLYAQGCIFDYRFLVDRATFDEFAEIEDSGEGAVLAATAFAERPCATYGDFGVMAPKESPGTKLQAMEICAQGDEDAMKAFCGDFKGYFRPDPRGND
jgi:hypothetical protein